MNKVSKKIILCSVFALYCSWAEGCCESSQIRSEFIKLHRIDFENDLQKIDKFKKSAQNEKAYLQNEKANISARKGYNYKKIVESLRLEIRNIDVMLFVLDKIEEYRQDIGHQKKIEIESALWEYVDYYPIVRNLVKEVVSFGADLSTSSSGGNSSEEKEKEGVAVDKNDISNFEQNCIK